MMFKKNIYNFFLIRFLIVFLTLVFGSCSSKNQNLEDTNYQERSLKVIYNSALNKLLNKDYQEASIEFDEVERQHPYSRWAKKSILMSSYSSYKNEDYIKCEANISRFISLYPASESVSYAQYLLAMCYYDQILDPQRDQTAVQMAYNTFNLILDRYPDTPYAKEAYYKIIFLEDSLAAKEMNVAKTYTSLKKYIASLKRYKNIVNQYQTSSFVAEALYRIVEIYLILGVKEEAVINARVLGYNYPGSKWYKFSYKLFEDNKEFMNK